MNKLCKIIGLAALALQLPSAVRADQNPGPTHPGAYVLCNDGSMYGYHFDGNGGSTYASAVALCNLNGGGVSRQNIRPKNPLYWGDGKAAVAAGPRDTGLTAPSTAPNLAGAVRDLLASPVRAVELRSFIRANNSDGIRRLLLASPRISRAQIAAIKNAVIGPMPSPIFWIPNDPEKCIPTATTTYNIGGVLVSDANLSGCNPTG